MVFAGAKRIEKPIQAVSDLTSTDTRGKKKTAEKAAENVTEGAEVKKPRRAKKKA